MKSAKCEERTAKGAKCEERTAKSTDPPRMECSDDLHVGARPSVLGGVFFTLSCFPGAGESPVTPLVVGGKKKTDLISENIFKFRDKNF